MQDGVLRADEATSSFFSGLSGKRKAGQKAKADPDAALFNQRHAAAHARMAAEERDYHRKAGRDDDADGDDATAAGPSASRDRQSAVSAAATAHTVSDKGGLTGKQLQDAVQWLDLGICKSLVRAVGHMGYLRPTPVQALAIPHGLKGLDLCVRAVTGSGKTAAYMLPLLHKLLTTSPYPRSGYYRRHPRSLLLVPSRELAQQCEDSARQLVQFAADKVQIALVIGGMSAQAQEAALANGPDLVVATPGRLCDVYTNFDMSAQNARTLQAASAIASGARETPETLAGGSLARSKLHYAEHSQTKSAPTVAKSSTNRARDFLDMSKMEAVVFDECDKLVAPELLAQVQDICERTIHRRVPTNKAGRVLTPRDDSVKPPQVLLFSATMTNAVAEFADKYLVTRPLNLDIGNVALASQLRQHFVRVKALEGEQGQTLSEGDSEAVSMTKAKTAYLTAACKEHYNRDGTLIFCKFKTTVHRLTALFNALAALGPEAGYEGFAAAELQSSQSTEERAAALERFKKGEVKYLFATDVGSRGLDLEGAITTVINFDMPSTLPSYIHRVGRTARIGLKGLAVSLVNEVIDADIMRAILALSRNAEHGDSKLTVAEVRRRVLRDEAVSAAAEKVEEVFPAVREQLAAEEVQAKIDEVEKKLTSRFDDDLVPITLKQRALAAQRRRLEALDEHARNPASSENAENRVRRRRAWRRRLEKQEAELQAKAASVAELHKGAMSLAGARRQWIMSKEEVERRNQLAKESYEKQHASALQEAEAQMATLDREHARLNKRDRDIKARKKEREAQVKEKERGERKRVMEKEAKKVQAGLMKKIRKKKIGAARREARREKNLQAKGEKRSRKTQGKRGKAGTRKKYKRR